MVLVATLISGHAEGLLFVFQPLLFLGSLWLRWPTYLEKIVESLEAFIVGDATATPPVFVRVENVVIFTAIQFCQSSLRRLWPKFGFSHRLFLVWFRVLDVRRFWSFCISARNIGVTISSLYGSLNF